MKTPMLLTSRYWRLFQAVLESVVEAFRFKNMLINSLIRLVFFLFVLRYASRLYNMEVQLEAEGHLQNISRELLEPYTQDILIHNANRVPLTGPVLFVANHAGIGDSISIFMSSPRTDIFTLIYNQGMLTKFQEFQRYAIAVDKDNPMLSLRATIRHLKQGRAVLLFPRGHVEDDPALYLDSALSNLLEWSPSLEFLVRKVPDLQVVPVAVGGMISRKAMANPIVQQYKNRDYQHFLAGTFQMVTPFYKDPILSIFYGEPLAGQSASLANVQSKMHELLTQIHDEQSRLHPDH